MTKLLFLFADCQKFVVRIGEEGFIEECKKHECAPCRIIALNGLTEEPKHGSILLFERGKRLYTVQPNEDLSSLSERFGVLEDELLQYNCVSYIYPYQVIEIP